jgi:recombinational DNA repair protein (RecF pathway)
MRSRGLGAIASAVTDWYGVQLKADMETLSIVLDTLRIFERIVGPAERDMDIYDRLQGFLEQTEHRVSEHDPLRILLLAQAFLLQTLARLGYHLELSQSMLTGEPLMRGQRYGFSPAEGGFVEWERALHRTGLIPLQENTIKLLRLCLTHSLETLGRVRTEASVIAEVKQVVEALTRWIG